MKPIWNSHRTLRTALMIAACLLPALALRAGDGTDGPVLGKNDALFLLRQLGELAVSA